MYLADTLSRAYIVGKSDQSLEDDIGKVIYSLITNTPVSTAKFAEIRDQTEQDKILVAIKDLILRGWPKSVKSITSDLRCYWNIRHELYVAEGVIFFGDRIVIPKALQQQMLSLIHESHLGMEKCKARARAVMYWPCMSKDIEQTVSQCAVCCKFQRSQTKEPMTPHQIPDGRFEKIAMDIMSFKGKDYLVVVDYYSKYPELSLLVDKTASTIISHTKSVCARHGIPQEIVSDNMPFASYQFKSFAEEWGITVTTSSPGFPQSNGQAERFVQTLKRMLKKAEEDGQDPYLALLEYRNTPVSGLPYSPAQLLMSRSLRLKLPVKPSLLQPRVVNAHFELGKRQEYQRKFHDRGANPLPSLNSGDVVGCSVERRGSQQSS